jgi:hypothetical protein
MKKLIQKVAYKLCSTEVKMLLDKLDEGKEKVGLTVLSKNLVPSHGYLHIVNTGKFSVPERIALAIKMNDIHRVATKMTIVETIFDGEQKAENHAAKMSGFRSQTTPQSIITTTAMKTQALKILEQEMDKDYNNVLRAHIDEHKDATGALRNKGLL